MGFLEAVTDTVCYLKESRRLWEWFGAFTLNEVSQKGVAEKSRISEPVPRIYLTGVLEIIPCSEVAQADLMRTRNGI